MTGDIGNFTHNGPPEDDEDDGRPVSLREGWIARHRSVRAHWLVGHGIRVKAADDTRKWCHNQGEAWEDLLMECRYSAGYVMNGGHKMELRRGELIGAVSWLASRWNWTPKTVRRFLDQLEGDGMIELKVPGVENGTQKGKQATVLNICNYDTYQSVVANKGQAKGQAEGTQGASRGQAEGNIYKEETREQGNKSPLIESRADDLARQAYEDGLRIKQGVTTKSARAGQRSVGSLDGSQGIAFAKGKLTVFNGAAVALAKDFPGINIGEVCNRAGPDIAKLSYPSADDAMAVLRKWAQIVSTNKPQGGQAKSDPIKQMEILVGGKR